MIPYKTVPQELREDLIESGSINFVDIYFDIAEYSNSSEYHNEPSMIK